MATNYVLPVASCQLPVAVSQSGRSFPTEANDCIAADDMSGGPVFNRSSQAKAAASRFERPIDI